MLSVTKIEKCPCCSSENIVKNGFTKQGNQRVLCHDCLKSRVLHRKFSLDFEAVKRSFLERMRLCGISRVFLISYYQVYKELNLCFLLLPNFKSQVIENKQCTDIIEFDELCGFCQKKKNKQWIWAAISRNTKQIVAYVIGDRSESTFKRLIRKIPLEYLKCQSFSDYWRSYAILKSKENHQQVGKESGQTNWRRPVILNDIGQR